MARLTMAQTYAYARQGGFDAASATIVAAIAMAESGLNTAARGDVGLQDSYWGPSVGLMQIRTVKSQTGTGGDRDITRLSDPVQNMVAAYHISSRGKDFSPWSTYKDKRYRTFLGQSSTAAAAAGNATPQAVQAAAVGDALGLGDALGNAKTLGLMLLAVAAGGALIIMGGYRAVGSPKMPKAAAAVLL